MIARVFTTLLGALAIGGLLAAVIAVGVFLAWS